MAAPLPVESCKHVVTLPPDLPPQTHALAGSRAQLLTAVVHSAGRWLAQHHIRPDTGVDSHLDPVLRAAQLSARAARYVADTLAEHLPDDAIICDGEPFTYDRPTSASGTPSGVTWVLTGIDGRTNYARGRAEYALSAVALHTPAATPVTLDSPALCAAITLPAHERTLHATCTPGELSITAHPPYRASARTNTATGTTATSISTALVGVELSPRGDHRTAALASLVGLGADLGGVRSSGSSAYDLAEVVVGNLDAYLTRTPRVRDVAAGLLLARSAGLQVRRWNTADGASWLLVADPDLAREIARALA